MNDHTLEMTDIIALPEMTEELIGQLCDTYETGYETADSMRAVVAAYLDATVRWQPISVGDIQSGMRVRQTLHHDGVVQYAVGIVQVDINGWVRFPDSVFDPDLGAWEVDPRTIPTDPDQSILDLLAQWYPQGPESAVDLLAELRAIADVTPKVVP